MALQFFFIEISIEYLTNTKIFLNPYYKVDDHYFRYEKRINNLIKNYKTCKINSSLCDKQVEALVLKKRFGKYIIKRKND